MKLSADQFVRVSKARHFAVLATLCLLAFMAAAQALHVHSGEFSSADVKQCSLCQVAHGTAKIAPVAHVSFSLAVADFINSSPDPRPKPVLVLFSLLSRPPPSLV